MCSTTRTPRCVPPRRCCGPCACAATGWASPPMHWPMPRWCATTSTAAPPCTSGASAWPWSATRPSAASAPCRLPPGRRPKPRLRQARKDSSSDPPSEVKRRVDMKTGTKVWGRALAAGAVMAAATAGGVAAADGVSYQELADALHTVMESDRTVYTRTVVNRLQNEEKVIKASEHWKDDK